MFELTDKLIAQSPAPNKGHVEIGDLVVPGLRVRIKSTGIKTFLVRKRVGARVQAVQLGDFDSTQFPLCEARQRAKLLIDLLSGKQSEGPAQPPVKTIAELFDRYLAAKSQLRTVKETERIFRRHILPAFGHRAPEGVTRSEVTLLIDEVPTASMARAVAGQFSAFFTWLEPRCDAIAANPCRGAGKPSAVRSRDRVLSAAELRALWAVTQRDPSQFSRGIQLLLLTLQRRNEVFGADCSEFDLDLACWTIPAARSKNGLVHEVPLTPPVIALLKHQMNGRDLGKLFPARGVPERSLSGFTKCWQRIRRAVDVELNVMSERFTMHDLRRTGATQMQRLGIKIEVTESVLNHVSGSRRGIVGVYQRYGYHEEKRHALASWANELSSIVERSG